MEGGGKEGREEGRKGERKQAMLRRGERRYR